METENEMIPTRTAAARLGVALSTALKWARLYPRARKIAGRWFVDREFFMWWTDQYHRRGRPRKKGGQDDREDDHF